MAEQKPYLIAGLGNPGPEYKMNRHNIGFMVVDEIARQLGLEFRRVQSNALVVKGQHGDTPLVLAKPRTYMNRSGDAVAALVRFYKVPQDQILAIYDEVDLPFEALRMRPDGGSAGHKGMRSLIQRLGTKEFARLRVGVGRPKGRMATPAHVLQDFSRDEQEFLPVTIKRAAEAALCFVDEGVVTAMNKYNGAEE